MGSLHRDRAGAFAVMAALVTMPPLVLLHLLTANGVVPGLLPSFGMAVMLPLVLVGILLSRGSLRYEDPVIRSAAWVLPFVLIADLGMTLVIGASWLASDAANLTTFVMVALTILPLGFISNYEARKVWRREAQMP